MTTSAGGGLRCIAHPNYRTGGWHGASQAADGYMYLGAQATAQAADRLIFRPPFSFRRLMRSDDGGIDDKLFAALIIGRCLEEPPLNTLDDPSTY